MPGSRSKTTSQPKVSPTVSAEDVKGSNGKRRKNFLKVENELLVKAYIHTTLDPVHGTDQKSEVFWVSVRNQFQDSRAL